MDPINWTNIDIEINKSVHYNGAILYYQSKTLFFDYSDDSVFIDSPSKYDFYFKTFSFNYHYFNKLFIQEFFHN